MLLAGRIILVLLSIFVVWTMVRACKTGTLFSQGVGYSVDEQPMMFAFGLVVHGFCVGLLLWFAAGYDGPTLLRLFGIDPAMLARWSVG